MHTYQLFAEIHLPEPALLQIETYKKCSKEEHKKYMKQISIMKNNP